MDCKNEFHSDDDFDCSSNGYSDSANNNSGYTSNGQQRMTNPSGLSKAELRKTNKPIMEKRRRARINHCLNELKSLILEAMKKDPARHTKLEKADILEMTVKHLQSVQRQQLNMAIQTDPSVIHKFKTGFVECTEEVNRYVSQLEGVDAGVRQRLTSHLSNCATSLEQIGSMTNFNNGYRGQLPASTAGLFAGVAPLPNPLASAATISTPNALFPTVPQDLNNNNNISNNSAPGAPIQMGGVQLIPSRLPSGEFALIMPNASTNPASLSNSPFAAWPHANLSGAPPNAPALPTQPINDFTTNFKRMSAFTKPQMHLQPPTQQQQQQQQQQPKLTTVAGNTNPTTVFQPAPNNLHHNSTTTTSPPLSPISSVSSHGDDSSMMHTSSDFGASRPATPPHDVTPHKASQHNFSGVFSTPSSAESSASLCLSLSLSSTTNSTRSSVHLQQQQVSSTSGSELNGSLKRSLSSTEASVDSSDSSDEPSAKRFAAKTVKELDFDEAERDSMWRPW